MSDRWPLWRWAELSGPDGGEPYAYRMALANLWGRCSLYLHVFVGDDWSRDPHDHPKWFLSIGLWGSYDEEVYTVPDHAWDRPELAGIERFVAPWVRWFPAEHIHRLRVPEGKRVVTLCITGTQTREWGFWSKAAGRWQHYRSYLSEAVGRPREYE